MSAAGIWHIAANVVQQPCGCAEWDHWARGAWVHKAYRCWKHQS